MAEIFLLLLGLIVLLFGLVVLRGAPFLPTLKPTSEVVIDLLGLQSGDTLLELGSGDGRILATAAKKGINAVGYELNPLLVIWTRLRYWRYRRLITVHWGDFWWASWPPSDGMYVFLLDRFMPKLYKHIIQYNPKKPYNVVSNSFEFPDKKPTKRHGSLNLYTF